MNCSKCGLSLDPGTNFCPKCGTPVTKNDNGKIPVIINEDFSVEIDKDNAEGLYNIGYAYYTGTNGYTKDFQKAFEFFKKAADLKYLEAVNYIGLMNLNGEAVLQNTPNAIHWFTYALSLDPTFGRAAYNLGRIYLNGTGVPVNQPLAYQYFDRAIKAKNAKNESYYGYACLYAGFILMQMNQNKESVPLLFEAVKADDKLSYAWYNLGVLNEKKVFRSTDGSCYSDYYKKAAQLGCPEAMDAMGRENVRLYGIVKQKGDENRAFDFYSSAVQWYEEAIKNGYEPSKKHLKLLKFSDSGSYLDLIK